MLTETCLLPMGYVAAGYWLRECKVCLMLCPELNLPWGLFPSHLPQLWPFQFFNTEAWSGWDGQICTQLLEARGKPLRKKLLKNVEVLQKMSAPQTHPGSHCSPSYCNDSILRPMQPSTSSLKQTVSDFKERPKNLSEEDDLLRLSLYPYE